MEGQSLPQIIQIFYTTQEVSWWPLSVMRMLNRRGLLRRPFLLGLNLFEIYPVEEVPTSSRSRIVAGPHIP